MIHSIRLASHWTTVEVAPGVFRHTRRFGAPRVTTESVWLAGKMSQSGTLAVNRGMPASIGEAFRVEITGLIQPRNEVAIETAGRVSEVRIEIA